MAEKPLTPRRRTLELQEIPETKDKIRPLPVLARYRSTDYSAQEDECTRTGRQARSHSADVSSYMRRDSLSRYNERYVNFSERGRLVNYRLMSDAGPIMSRYVPSPLARRISEGANPPIHPAGTRWITYARNSSPSPILRNPSYRRASEQQQPLFTAFKRQESLLEDESEKEKEKLETSSGWHPLKKFMTLGQTMTSNSVSDSSTATKQEEQQQQQQQQEKIKSPGVVHEDVDKTP